MDTHHKKLVEIANIIIEILRSEGDRGSPLKAVGALVDCTRRHFSAEEALMERYDYPHIQSHMQKHRQLVQQVTDYSDGILAGNLPEVSDLKKFFSDWLITYILSEDRKYGEFLNSKGIF